jgi:hypothetical protein
MKAYFLLLLLARIMSMPSEEEPLAIMPVGRIRGDVSGV